MLINAKILETDLPLYIQSSRFHNNIFFPSTMSLSSEMSHIHRSLCSSLFLNTAVIGLSQIH